MLTIANDDYCSVGNCSIPANTFTTCPPMPTSIPSGEYWNIGTSPCGELSIGTNPCVIEPYAQPARETKTHIIYDLPYPGVPKEKLDIYVRDDVLVIDHDGESEFVTVGKIEIDVDWDTYNRDDIAATCIDGVLSVAIAKILEDKSITVK